MRLDMVAKACSIVLYPSGLDGSLWTDGQPVPAQALALLTSEIEAPAAVEQVRL